MLLRLSWLKVWSKVPSAGAAEASSDSTALTLALALALADVAQRSPFDAKQSLSRAEQSRAKPLNRSAASPIHSPAQTPYHP